MTNVKWHWLFKSLMLWSLAFWAFDHVRRITLNTPLKHIACLEWQASLLMAVLFHGQLISLYHYFCFITMPLLRAESNYHARINRELSCVSSKQIYSKMIGQIALSLRQTGHRETSRLHVGNPWNTAWKAKVPQSSVNSWNFTHCWLSVRWIVKT